MGKTKKPSLLSQQNYYFVSEGGLFHDPHLVCSPSQNPCPAAQGFGLFAFIPHSSRLGSG